jgi:hypothetical protein
MTKAFKRGAAWAGASARGKRVGACLSGKAAGKRE